MTYTLTAIDIAALRQCDRIVVAFNKSNPSLRTTGVRLVKEPRKSASTPFAEETVHELTDCPVSVVHQPPGGSDPIAFALVYTYHSQADHESSIVRTLRAGDEIAFKFRADDHSNGYVAAAGLHADCLVLEVRRGEGKNRRALQYDLLTSIAPNNEGRMIRGLADSNDYLRNAARCRRECWKPPATMPEPAN